MGFGSDSSGFGSETLMVVFGRWLVGYPTSTNRDKISNSPHPRYSPSRIILLDARSYLLPLYFITDILGHVWYELSQKGWLDIDDYETFLEELKWLMVLLLWAIICCGAVPLLCHFDQGHCTSPWVAVFQKALLSTLVVAILWFVKGLVLEFLYIKSAVVSMNPKQTRFEKGVCAMYLSATATPDEVKKQSGDPKRSNSATKNYGMEKASLKKWPKQGNEAESKNAAMITDPKKDNTRMDHTVRNDEISMDDEESSDDDEFSDDEDAMDKKKAVDLNISKSKLERFMNLV